MGSDCVFCKIIAGKLPSEKLFESENFIVLKDVYPNVKGHSLVIPKRHIETFTELNDNFYEEFMHATKKGIEIVLHEQQTDAYNLIVNNKKLAGQVIPHLHMHILPRRSGDSFKSII